MRPCGVPCGSRTRPCRRRPPAVDPFNHRHMSLFAQPALLLRGDRGRNDIQLRAMQRPARALAMAQKAAKIERHDRATLGLNAELVDMRRAGVAVNLREAGLLVE